MITLTDRDRLIITAVLHKVPFLPELSLAALWPDTDTSRENMARRLRQLRDEGLLVRHMAYAQAAGVSLFYHWSPAMPEPDFGALAWALTKRWEATEPQPVAFYSATDRAAKHYGRAIRSPLKSPAAISHDLGLGAVYVHFAVHHPLLAGAWVAEDLIAGARGYGEKVVDACVVDSTSTPALAVEFAGASYAASNGERLREIHADCAARGLAYEMWTVLEGSSK
jgi:hypothetical protein